MKCSKLRVTFIVFLFMWTVLCSRTEQFVVVHQKTGPIQTNCFLLYGVDSKEAALFDVGGSIDSLLTILDDNNLE